jgi:hypothetical protein
MANHGQTVFYIERLQPDWLPGGQRWAFGLFNRMYVGLVFGMSFGPGMGLACELLLEPGERLFHEMFPWLVLGLISWPVFVLIYRPGGWMTRFGGWISWVSSDKIVCAETLSWSWPKKWVLVFILASALVAVPARAYAPLFPGFSGVFMENTRNSYDCA